jgi:eukaryotic-like serine/threonine-protein kinase
VTSASAKAPKFCSSCSGRFPGDALFCPNDGTPLLSALGAEPGENEPALPDAYLGREISGHIEIRQLAGVGAMGRVYRAFQKGIDRDVAVKVLHRELSANPQLVSRFHREAKVASRLQHPNVVHVHLAGQLPDGALYIVMEYLDGLSLQSALGAAQGAMPLSRALHVALQICDAVGEAHAQGVVHRDLKPENVMLVRRGQDADYVKVLDFGIARLSWGEQSMATAAGLIFGTARYISPEGAQGEAVGPPGDVYAIATLLYQMLAGRTPFEGDQAVGLLIQQIHDSPPPLQTITRASYVPEPIAAAVMKNLAKDPHARDPDARAFGRAIVDATKRSGISSDEFVARSMLLGTSPSQVRLAPMQQTKQMQLSPELAERLAAGAPSSAGSSPDLLPESTSAPPAAAAGQGLGPVASAATAKWNPPAGFQAELSRATAEQAAMNGEAARAGVRPPMPSGIDRTLDDADVPPMHGFPPPRTQISTSPERPRVLAPTPELPHLAHLAHLAPLPHLPSAAVLTTPLPMPSVPHAGIDDGARLQSARRAMQTPTPTKPFSNVDTTMSDAPAPHRFLRYAALFVLLFLVGSAAAAGVLYKIGLLEATAPARIDDYVARANDAVAHERWDAPPGNNVRDITNEGLAKWPNDARLLDARARASERLEARAIGLRGAGDLHGAAHLMRLATELDPTDQGARTLAAQFEEEATPHTDGSAPLVVLSDAGSLVTPARPVPAAGAPRATIDAAPPKPRLGQSVEFVAKVLTASGAAPKSPVTEGRFTIAGPGLGSGADLAAASEGNVFRAGFTFLERGRYEVSFSGKVDGQSVRSARAVVIEAPTPPPSTGTVEQPPPPPSGTVKWL